MSLVKSALTNAIVSAIQSEVSRCTADKFHPENFNSTVYLDAIYDYVKNNVEVQGAYVGTIPGTPPVPDPANGSYIFHASSAQSNPAVPKVAVALTQRSMTQYPPTAWWTALLNSLWINLNTTSTLVLSITIAPVLVKPSLVPFPQSEFEAITDQKTMNKYWEVISDKIISAIKSGTIVPTASVTTSSDGGTGATSFTQIR